MKISKHWVAISGLVWLAGCSAGANDEGELARQSEALAAAPATASASPQAAAKPNAVPSVRHRSQKRPDARKYATGRREIDEEELAQRALYLKPSQARRLSPLALAALPRAVDNSAHPAFPQIRNQEGIGSCVAFAVGYYVYTYELGRLAGWNNKNGNNTTKVSPKWLYNLANGGSDGGSSTWFVHRLLEEHGALTWAEFPYSGDTSNPVNYLEWPRTAAAWRSALRYKSLGSADISLWDIPMAIAQLKDVLAAGHLATFTTYAYSWEFEDIGDDPSTPADNALSGQSIITWQNGWDGAHEATIVGYNDDVWADINANGQVDAGEKGAFKIANSWGAEWENQGYAWVAYDALNFWTAVENGPSDLQRTSIMSQVTTLVGARRNYQPNLVAEFTLSTTSRGDLGLQIGLTELDRNDLIANFSPRAFSYNGGSHHFDGTNSQQPKSGTFAIDLSDFALSYGDLRHRLDVWNGHPTAAGLSGFALVDRLRNNLRTQTTDAALSVGQNQSKSQRVRYKFQDGARVPRLTLNPASSIAFGSLPLGTAATRTVSVQNTGTGDLVLTSLRSDNPLFLNRGGNLLRLAPGESGQFDVEFAPAASQSETGALSIRNTSSNLPSPNLALGGSATSGNDAAPFQVFITQQNDPQDNSMALRAEIKNRGTQTARLSDYQFVYYLNDPVIDPAVLRWDTYYTTHGTISAGMRKAFLTRTLGPRKADTAVTFRFQAGKTLAPGASMIFQGNLHRADWSWYPNETDDWSRFLRRDGLAEGTVFQHIASQNVLFGLAAEARPGALQFSASPTQVSNETTLTFVIDDPALVGAEFVEYVFKQSGELVDTWWTYPSALGPWTAVLPMGHLPAGPYTIVLTRDGVTLDAVEVTKL